MHLNPTIQKFYTSILAYSGIEDKDNRLVNTNEKLGDITIDDKPVKLPYYENLKNPDNSLIFHPLNENYTNPETEIFDIYKRKLTLELNLRFSHIFINCIRLASDVQLQKRIKSSKLIKIVSDVGEADPTFIENYLGLVKASQKVNKESFIFDIYLKKNGEVDGVPYSAIGKLNFLLYNEINKALDNPERDYKVYGYKLRKKDLLVYKNIFNVIFPDIDTPEKYTEGTDNKVFRYLNILLTTSYQVAVRLNEISELMEEVNDSSLDIEGSKSDLEWTNLLEKLYKLTSEIREIPMQTDISADQVSKLKVDESTVRNANISSNDNRQTSFNPSQNTQAYQPPPQQQTEQRTLTPEEIIRGTMNNYSPNMQPMMPMRQPMMNPNMMQPMMMLQPMQPSLPTWAQREIMTNNPNINPAILNNPQPMMQPMMMQQPMVNPNMMQPMMMQQPMMSMQQPMMNPNMMQPMMMQQPMQPSGIPINPQFIAPNQGFR